MLLNIQGLTRLKMLEVQKILADEKEPVIMCLTETHQKQDKIQLSKGFKKIEKMRDSHDKKGGGLMIIYREKDDVEMTIKDTKECDIMEAEVEVGKISFSLTLVYFSVDKTEEDRKRNVKLKTEVGRLATASKDKPQIILGDFNGHLGFLGTQQKNHNGERVLDLMETHSLQLLNGDMKCEGEITWCRGEQRSVIDFVLVNEAMYKRFHEMKVDENKEKYDLSDHNLIEVNFRMDVKKTKNLNTTSYKETTYFCCKEESLLQFIEDLEEALGEHDVTTIQEYNDLMIQIREQTLKKVYRRRVREECGECSPEPPWVTGEIKEEIKKRRSLNRQKRKEDGNKKQLEDAYRQQKKKVQQLVREAIHSYECKIVQDIKNDKHSGREIWKHIDKLRYREKKTSRIDLFEDKGEKLSDEDAKDQLYAFWKGIYQQHENSIKQMWNETEKKRYQEEIERTEQNDSQEQLKEHMDMIARMPQNEIRRMESSLFGIEELKSTLKRMKGGTAAGPDGLKPEMYKAILKSDKCLRTLHKCMNKTLTEKNIPQEWKKSRTRMLPKKKKPAARDLRPIALTNVSYKLFMSMIKDKIEKHLLVNNEMKETQAGFAPGGRVEDNLLIVQYCVEESFKSKKPLILLSIDYKKAYDSIRRDVLVDNMKKYKIDPLVIDAIAEIYNGDETVVELNESVKQTIEVTSGIRQGCTGSTTLFKLVTYIITEEIEKKGRGFINDMFNIHVLFYADDGLVMAQTIDDAKCNLKIVSEVSKSCGLDINKDKSCAIIWNMKEKPDNISGIQVQEGIKYLGIDIVNKRDMFKEQKRKMMERACKMANLTVPIIYKSCSRLLIGKTFWKSVAIPSILYGSSIISFTDSEIKHLQRQENKVYRSILGAPIYAPNCSLRGEIGASEMKTRIMKGRLMYLKNIQMRENKLLKNIVEEMKTQTRSNWTKTNLKYIEAFGIADDMERTTRQDLVNKARQIDSEKWNEEVQSKTSLTLYREWKKEVKEDLVYDNRPSSIILFKARTATLPLNERKRHIGQSTECDLCGSELENTEHFC